MSTPSLTAQARLNELLPRAIAEGWDVPRLAQEARVGKHAANVALRERVGQITAASEHQSGVMLAMVQKEAAQERPAVLARLRSAGECADALLAKAQELIEALDPEDDAAADDEEEEERIRLEAQGHGGALQRWRRALTLEDRLSGLAATVKAAASASKDCWHAFKDAAGLTFAEEMARAATKSTGKARPVPVAGMLVELDSDGARSDPGQN